MSYTKSVHGRYGKHENLSINLGAQLPYVCTLLVIPLSTGKTQQGLAYIRVATKILWITLCFLDKIDSDYS